MEGFKITQDIDFHDVGCHYAEYVRKACKDEVEQKRIIANLDVVLKDYKELTGDKKNITGKVG